MENIIDTLKKINDSLKKDDKIRRSNFLKSAKDFKFEYESEAIPAWQKLGSRNWFLNMEIEIVAPLYLADEIEKENYDFVDNHLINFYQKKLINIEKQLIKENPKRKNIIEACFEAHREENYLLSVPVFLSQVDGICYDYFSGNNYFIKNHRTKIETDCKNDGKYLKYLVEIFYNNYPVALTKNQRDENFNFLSRHKVLHGEDTNYGSLLYSCQAISLLSFVSSFAVSMTK